MIGSTIKVVATAENGNTFESDPTEPVEENNFGVIEIESAEATAVNVVEVTLVNSVDPDDTAVTLSKGTVNYTSTVAWDDDYDVATITTASKLTAGTYTVTVSSIEDETNEDSTEVEIENQKVYEIRILTDEALTDHDQRDVAYSSYDVFDQYGNSLRASTTITWAGSCQITADKATGKLTLKKTTENDEWVYGEQIYVTGVYAKTGASVNATLKVGTEQALDSLEIAGFLKKGTSNIVQTLPKDFKEDTYYLLFKPLDQEGTQLDVDDLQGNDVTFVSDNVLVIKEVKTAIEEKTVAGETYAAVLVSPGIRVSDGGEVTITAIANRTGNKTEISMVVGEDQVLKTFKLLAPTETVADGDANVNIPFEAYDEGDDEITDFVTLAKQTTFNTLSFTASDNSTLTLQEQADGSAKLLWTDAADPGWNDTKTTDGIARPISLTAVVVGGEGDNEMIDVEDRRRPNAVIGVDMDSVYTEGAPISFTATGDGGANSFESFQFEDQYGKTIKGTKGTKKIYGDSTGFFAAANGTAVQALNSSDIDISGYTFGVKVQNAGSNKILSAGSTGATVYNDVVGAVCNESGVLTGTGVINFRTATNVTSTATNEGFKFTIVKKKTPVNGDADEWENVTPSKYAPCTVVDLSQVKSFSIDDLNKFYVGNLATITGEGKIKTTALANLKNDAGDHTTGAATLGLTLVDKYQQKVVVKGTWNGLPVTIPVEYYSVLGSKISTFETTGDTVRGNNVITKIRTDSTTPLVSTDLYDAKTSEGVSKDAEDTLKVSLYNIYSDTAYVPAGKTYNKLVANAATTVGGWDENTADTAVAALFEASTATTTNGANARSYDAYVAEVKAANDAIDSLVGSLPAAVVNGTHYNDIVAEFNAKKVANTATIPDTKLLVAGLYDTVSKKITISDQKSVATTIDGLKEAYTIDPTDTKYDPTTAITDKLATTGADITVKVKDQYGAVLTTALNYKISEVEENKDAYAENNFSVSGNDTPNVTVVGAERGDKFKLTLTQDNATASTIITVGADTNASIANNINNYHDLVDDYLEPQRLAGLG